jgi:cell division protein FtsI/penicillin-binding protein 2
MKGYIAAPEEENIRRTARVRTRIVLAVMILWAGAIVVRLFHLQFFTHQEAMGQIEFQSQTEAVIYPDRGVIRDRRGTVLAQMVTRQSVQYFFAENTTPETRLALIRKLAPVLGLEESRIDSFRDNLSRKRGSVWLKRKIDAETAARVRALDLPGVKLYEEPLRFYPQGSLAAHVLGFVSIDNEGLGGIEYQRNGDLKGKPGKEILYLDVTGRSYRSEQIEAPERGRDIDLTLDARIQYIAQREIEKAVSANNAAWGGVVVSDPATGEILAMASAPSYDPNAYAESDPRSHFERTFRTLIDPGSTFKIVTAAAALENRKVATFETFDCSAKAIEVAGGPIRDHKPFGVLTFSGIIAESSNIGTIQIGRRVGPELLYRTIKDFGFGEKTGLNLSAEVAGVVHPLNEWSRRSIDSISVGYEVSVTLLQLLQAVNIVANRGVRVPPRIIKQVDGRPWTPPADAAPPVRVISAQTAEKLIDILERVVLEGTGTAAALKGYTVAGKTGTSQIFDPVEKKYSMSRHTASFIGFVPSAKPVLSIGVVLFEPGNDAYYGGQVAAPVFRAIALPALRILGVVPSPLPSVRAEAHPQGDGQ